MQELLVNFSHRDFSEIQLESINYELAVLSILLVRPNEKIKLTFDWVYSLRVTDEGDLLKMLEYFDGEMTTGIYRMKNSTYLEWFNYQSENIHSEDVEHYFIVTIDEVVEVLASVEPVVDILLN